jgi:putative transposase
VVAWVAAVRRWKPIGREIVKRSDAAAGFEVLPKRWSVERTFGWLGRSRRLSKDSEGTTSSHEAGIKRAMIHLRARRIVKRLKTLPLPTRS